MQNIKIIESTKDQIKFQNLCAYCFQDENNWTQRIFEMDEKDICYAWFDDDVLSSGMLSKTYNASLFGENVLLNGISCVITAPNYRNQRQVLELFQQLLTDEYKKGKIFSALYPFSFRFYGKVGYGAISPLHSCIFRPEDIAKYSQACQIVQFDSTQKQLEDSFKVYNAWIKNFDFGVVRDFPQLERYINELKKEKDFLFLHYNNEGKCTGSIKLNFKYLEKFVTRMKIRQLAWTDNAAFQSLMHFLWTHRGQCRDIEWNVPVSIPSQWILNEQKMRIKRAHWWMGRALNIHKLLELKLKKSPVQTEFAFSIEDNVVFENSGTYVISDNGFKYNPDISEKVIPLSVFSSLLFGGISWNHAVLTGLIDFEMDEILNNFFCENGNVYLSEFF